MSHINCCGGKYWIIGSCHITCTACVSTLPPQHKDNRELSEKLSFVEKILSVEREKQTIEIRNLLKSEQEARSKAEKLPSLLEQLSLLQHELEKIHKEKEELEERTKVYKDQTQQVSLTHESESNLTVC